MASRAKTKKVKIFLKFSPMCIFYVEIMISSLLTANYRCFMLITGKARKPKKKFCRLHNAKNCFLIASTVVAGEAGGHLKKSYLSHNWT